MYTRICISQTILLSYCPRTRAHAGGTQCMCELMHEVSTTANNVCAIVIALHTKCLLSVWIMVSKLDTLCYLLNNVEICIEKLFMLTEYLLRLKRYDFQDFVIFELLNCVCSSICAQNTAPPTSTNEH